LEQKCQTAASPRLLQQSLGDWRDDFFRAHTNQTRELHKGFCAVRLFAALQQVIGTQWFIIIAGIGSWRENGLTRRPRIPTLNSAGLIQVKSFAAG
jgi:hypothetical protein